MYPGEVSTLSDTDRPEVSDRSDTRRGIFQFRMSELARAALDHWVAIALDSTPTVIERLPATAETLRAIMDRSAPEPWLPARIVELMVPLCRLLGAIHESGTVHRDLSPSVVWVDGATIYLGGWHAAVSVGDTTPIERAREP